VDTLNSRARQSETPFERLSLSSPLGLKVREE